MHGNQKSVIRDTFLGTNTVETYTPGIVSCDELRYFWLRWSNSRLEVRVEVGGGLVIIDVIDDVFDRSIFSYCCQTPIEFFRASVT